MTSRMLAAIPLTDDERAASSTLSMWATHSTRRSAVVERCRRGAR